MRVVIFGGLLTASERRGLSVCLCVWTFLVGLLKKGLACSQDTARGRQATHSLSFNSGKLNVNFLTNG